MVKLVKLLVVILGVVSTALASGLTPNGMTEDTTPDDERQHAYSSDASNYEQVKARHILVAFVGSPAAREDKPLLSVEEARAKAEAIRQKLLADDDFEELARTESDDTSSASRGGDLGIFGRGTMVPEFERVAFGAKVGEIPPVFRTVFGFHIIRVDEHATVPWSESPAGRLGNRLIARVEDKQWRPLQWSLPANGSEGAVYFVSYKRGWRKTGSNTYRVWTRTEVSPPRTLARSVYDYYLEDAEHDCKGFKTRVFAQHFYAPGGSYQSVIPARPQWFDLIPGSEGEAFHAALCETIESDLGTK